MTPDFANLNYGAPSATLAPSPVRRVPTRLLKNQDEAEVLGFLQERPLHNAIMSGFIRDHGIESACNRGRFFGACAESGRLEAVALIGHATFIDVREDTVIPALAGLAQTFPRIHMVLGEQTTVEQFWRSYAEKGQRLRRRCREVLFELTELAPNVAPVPELQLATLANLNQVAAVQAALACEESGRDPLTLDRTGFLFRCQRRIERQRVWTWVRDGQVIFKADVITETPEVIYLEGIYVNPTERNKGLGARCVTQLARLLLKRTRSIIVLANENKTEVHRFFQRVGFVVRGLYESLFLEIRSPGDAQ